MARGGSEGHFNERFLICPEVGCHGCWLPDMQNQTVIIDLIPHPSEKQEQMHFLCRYVSGIYSYFFFFFSKTRLFCVRPSP